MSEPKRGMVAGQPIQTGELTQAYEDGFARTFGERKPERGRFVYSAELGKCISVDEAWTDAERRAPVATEELVYGEAKATDGTPINTRKRHREYLQRHGLAMAGDFSDDFRERVHKERERREDAERRETIGRVVHKFHKG